MLFKIVPICWKTKQNKTLCFMVGERALQGKMLSVQSVLLMLGTEAHRAEGKNQLLSAVLVPHALKTKKCLTHLKL